MSVTLESPLTCISPGYDKTFEELCADWIQYDKTQPSTPQVVSSAPSVPSFEIDGSNTWLDYQEWDLTISPQLPLLNPQSPRSFRPYATPLARTTTTIELSDCYFSHQHHSDLTHGDYRSYNQHNDSMQSAESSSHRKNESNTSEGIDFRMTTPSKAPSPVPTDRSEDRPFCGPGQSQKRKHTFSNDDPMRIMPYMHGVLGPGCNMVEWGERQQGRSKMEGQSLMMYRLNRRYGACKNCKRRRRKCNRSWYPYIECLNTKPFNFIDRPTEVRLFRERPALGHPLFSTMPELYSLQDLSTVAGAQSNSISQEIPGQSLQIFMTEFLPHAELKTTRVYTITNNLLRRTTRSLDMPRLCLASIPSTIRALDTYIKQSHHLYLESIILKTDKITQQALCNAMQYTINGRRPSTCLVRRALKLLALVRMIELDWTFTGSEIPGMAIVTDRECPWYQKRPITAVIDTQLDQIVIQRFLTPLSSELLKDLTKKVSKSRKEDWFEVFLAVFVLLTNTALLLKHSRKNAIQCGAAHRYNSLQLAEQYFHGSNILIAHFLRSRNGVVGILQDKVATVGLPQYQEDFLRDLAGTIHSQRARFWELRSSKSYENDLYWSHQMFFEDWIPEERAVAEA